MDRANWTAFGGVALLTLAGTLLYATAHSRRDEALLVSAPGSPFAVGRQPAGVAIGDVNGDAKVDAVVANQGSNNVTVLLGDGRGGFQNAPGSPFAAGPKPHLIVLGDVNHDGKLDCAVTEHDSIEVRLFLGRGDGRFERAPGSPFVAHAGRPHNHGLSLTDINHDGNLDIITSNQDDHSVSVLLGNGKGDFAAAHGSPFTVGGSPYPHAIGDVNGDGNPDIVTPNLRESSMGVLLGDGSGGFRPAPGSPVRVPARPYYVGLGDVNNDGKLDAVLRHDDVSFVSVLIGDGRGGFRPAPESPVDVGAQGSHILLRDLDGDGRLDLITSSAQGAVIVMLGNGRGGFSQAPGSPYVAGRGPWNLDIGDLNGDGKVDVVTANHDTDNITVLLGR